MTLSNFGSLEPFRKHVRSHIIIITTVQCMMVGQYLFLLM